MKLEYTKCGDYYLPNIAIPEECKETKDNKGWNTLLYRSFC